MNTPIFDQTCNDWPDLIWTVDEEQIRDYQGRTLRVITVNELHTL